MYQSSKSIFERAQNSLPGGVNSPVRAFKSVGGTPIFMKKAHGAYMFDEDGNTYIDLINSWGPMILGHAYPPVIKAIQDKAVDSTSFGAPTLLEVEMAELMKSMVPNCDMVRMVNSGTEACMSAVRLARGYTGRNKIIKFEGCYHGHADMFLVKAGSGVATFNIQQIPGVTESVAQDTLACRYNDIENIKSLFAQYPQEIAAVIIEPVAGNMGCVPPLPTFLQELRDLCTQHNTVLIFDEVMTGFRLSAGGAQAHLSIDADIMTFGKVIGGGMPVGAVAGKKHIMSHFAPLGNVYQAGTLSGNPLAMTAGYTMLKTLYEHPEIYASLEKKSAYLQEGLKNILTQANIPHTINRVGSMLSIFFTDQPVIDWESAALTDTKYFSAFFHEMLKRGVYLPPSAFETYFISDALTYEDLDKIIEAATEAVENIV